jgi:hypothetical protein
MQRDFTAGVTVYLSEAPSHGLINYIGKYGTITKQNVSLKKLTCKETLRQVFVRISIYRLEIQSLC